MRWGGLVDFSVCPPPTRISNGVLRGRRIPILFVCRCAQRESKKMRSPFLFADLNSVVSLDRAGLANLFERDVCACELFDRPGPRALSGVRGSKQECAARAGHRYATSWDAA